MSSCCSSTFLCQVVSKNTVTKRHNHRTAATPIHVLCPTITIELLSRRNMPHDAGSYLRVAVSQKYQSCTAGHNSLVSTGKRTHRKYEEKEIQSRQSSRHEIHIAHLLCLLFNLPRKGVQLLPQGVDFSTHHFRLLDANLLLEDRFQPTRTNELLAQLERPSYVILPPRRRSLSIISTA